MTDLQHQIASLFVNGSELSFAGVYHQLDLPLEEVTEAFLDMLNNKLIEHRGDRNGEIVYGLTSLGND